MTYEAQIRIYIKPKLGDVPLVLFVRGAAERVEPFYAHLRRCRGLRNGKPFVEVRRCSASRCGEPRFGSQVGQPR